MRLSEFIRANIDRIVGEWEQFAGDLPSAHSRARGALREHAGAVLKAIADTLDHDRTADGPGPGTLAAARIAQGFSIGETAAEFRALRGSVLQRWSDSNAAGTPLDSADLIRFNEAIDLALAEAVARHMSEQAENSRLFDTMLSSSPDLNYIFDPAGKFVYANRALADLCGMPLHELVGKRFDEVARVHGAELMRNMHHVVKSKATFCGELASETPDQQRRIFEYLLIPVLDQGGHVEAIAGTARDVTERKAAEENSKRKANYDCLTGLPNRSLFIDRLAHEVKRAKRTGWPLALLFVDLDGFKEVNDRLGHEAGDCLLRQCAQRLTSCVRDSDTVARLGGDEFTVMLSDVHKLSHVEILAREILQKLGTPFELNDDEVRISGSIGIALMPHDASTPEELMRNADQAMYMAKQAGRDRFCFFTKGLQNTAWARVKAIDELRHAVRRHQFAVYFQPIIELRSGRIAKAEALLRWRHPHGGIRCAGEFIGLAEETGLIGGIGEWVLGEAAARASEWSAVRGAPFQVNVNKSAVELMSKVPQETWDAQMGALGRARQHIALEVCEDVLLSESPGIRDKLESLRKSGVELVVHDFGIQCASLTSVKKHAVSSIKIDQSLVRNLTDEGDARDVIGAIIAMAHKLGATVIATGVETPGQRDWLTEAECDYAQGYLFSEPLACRAFAKLLAADQAAIAARGSAMLRDGESRRVI